ncbi:MAG: hypothetical protein ACI8ZM_003169 [Crocinitomix sp.]|jgi:hypothetical protein
MDLIKSSRKLKPGKGFTYSLGLKAISESLYGCKHYEGLSLWFNQDIGRKIGVFEPGWYDERKLKGSSEELLSFRCIVSVNYSAVLEEWSMTLYSVEISKNKETREFLINTGLPLIKKWLNATKAATWYAGHRCLQIGLDYNSNEYCLFETKNDRIIEKKIAAIQEL